MTTPGREARAYVAGLADPDLDAMLERQLSARLRAAGEAERARRRQEDDK